MVAHVADRIRGGARKAAIREQLLAVGWSDEDVESAYAQACAVCGIPAPAHEVGGSARYATVQAVINLFSFFLLGTVAIALGNLVFGIITIAYPDVTASIYAYQSSTGAIRYAIAALIVAFPLYWGAMRMWFGRFSADPTAHEHKGTQLLTYLVLLIAAGTVMGDLIVAINAFLQGELTIRFVLKALTILAIAGGVFAFYYLERRMVQYRRPIDRGVFRLFGTVTAIMIITAVIGGLVAVGSPSTARLQALDAERANDLSNLASCVDGYAQEYGRMPASLETLTMAPSYMYCTDYLTDPETETPYTFRVVSGPARTGGRLDATIELCATFTTDTAGTETGKSVYPWSEHPVGESCDTAEITAIDVADTYAPTSERMPALPAPDRDTAY